ncbi:hypothetical protein DMUE_6188 [Dictyocoela muelleri]|nr:hypothetical protein DMUE_6188 [Dictyocoela muelleri]
MITKTRKKKNFIIKDDEIPETIKETFSKQKFLLYNNNVSDNRKILIFITKTHLLYLKKSIAWYCDGTFKTSPREFEQVYFIMGQIRNKNVPLVYIIMGNRSKECYKEAFNEIKNNINCEPKFIIIDFEMASLISLEETFTSSEITGCFFHFSQICSERLLNTIL